MNRNGFRLLMYYLFLLVAPTLVIADSSDETGSDISTDISTNSSTKNGSRSAESDTVTDSIPGDSNNDKPEKVDNVATDKTDQSLTGSDSLLDDEDKNTTVLKVVVIQIGEETLPIKDARVIITYGDATEFERKTDSSGSVSLPATFHSR